jgi:hypothetical protein
MAVDINFVPFDEIDTLRWNSCIHYAHNGNVFGYHWYLKNVVREFDALVEGEYESVMPLLKSKNRAGEDVLHHPTMLGRLGIFSVHVMSQARIQAFIDAIPDIYKEVNVLFNEYNNLGKLDLTNTNVKNWYQLSMNQPYEHFKRNYSSYVKKQIENAKELRLAPVSGMKPEQLIGFYKNLNTKVNEHAWMRIHYNLMHRGTAFPTMYQDSSGNKKAAGLFAYSNGYFVNLFFTAEKKNQHSLFYLMMDDVIRLHANRPLTLDFNQWNNENFQLRGMGAIAKPLYEWNKRSRWGKIVDWVTPW